VANEVAGRNGKIETAGHRAKTWCVVSPGLVPSVPDPLREALLAASIEVIAERRVRDRRVTRERRGGDDGMARPADLDRRRIRNATGRRVAERRASLVAVEPPPGITLPSQLAGGVNFVERLGVPRELLADMEAARLVFRVQSGDQEAFAGLYAQYFDSVLAYLRMVLEDEHEAEDGVQQVFIQALQALPRYERRGTPFRAWLFTIVRNHAITRLRKRSRVEPLDPHSLGERLDHQRAPEQELSALHWIEDGDLLVFVKRLPLAQRQVLLLRYMLDLSNAECAAIMGRTPNEAAALHYRALCFLEARLVALGREPSGRGRVHMRRRTREAHVLRARRFALAP
jgi:RNA polymerase sigma-70 factor (ECF subfamily)